MEVFLYSVILIFPNDEHGNSARHIHANLYKVHKGKEINLLFCNTVEAYNGSDFKLASKNLKPVLANSK